jgi:hypothetical protein
LVKLIRKFFKSKKTRYNKINLANVGFKIIITKINNVCALNVNNMVYRDLIYIYILFFGFNSVIRLMVILLVKSEIIISLKKSNKINKKEINHINLSLKSIEKNKITKEILNKSK